MSKINRISKDEYYLDIAFAVSKRSNCVKRHYGAIIVKDDVIIATGYNGSPRGEMNCTDLGTCHRLLVPGNSGDYATCHSVHAEQNAIIAADRSKMVGAVLYLAGEELDLDDMSKFDAENIKYRRIVKCSPCPICDRMIKNSGISVVIGEK